MSDNTYSILARLRRLEANYISQGQQDSPRETYRLAADTIEELEHKITLMLEAIQFAEYRRDWRVLAKYLPADAAARVNPAPELKEYEDVLLDHGLSILLGQMANDIMRISDLLSALAGHAAAPDLAKEIQCKMHFIGRRWNIWATRPRTNLTPWHEGLVGDFDDQIGD